MTLIVLGVAGEMAQQLGVLNALAHDPASTLSPYVVAHSCV